MVTNVNSFADLGICPWLHRNLLKLGISKPSAVQQKCIPAILCGRDVLAASQTGSGKTAAFALPIIQLLQKDPYGVFALCLTPTRELALQIVDQFKVFCNGTSLQCEAIIGGMDMKLQAKIIHSKPHVVVATPGRLMEHFLHSTVSRDSFSKVSVVVFDEADRLLEPSFDSEIRILVSNIPQKRQTLLFSATITRSISAIKGMQLNNVLHVELNNCSPVEMCRQRYCFVPNRIKDTYLFHIIKRLIAANTKSIVVFTNSIKTSELLHRISVQLDFSSVALHSMKKQRERKECLFKFKSQRVSILFATNVASRGIDIPSVNFVINYDTPSNVQDYVHRIGRTARAMRSGEAVTFVTQHEVERFLTIENALSTRMECYEVEEESIAAELTRSLAAKRTARLQMAEDFDLKFITHRRSK
jgi:ATP-dependent RNA helicase DDX49/DBP8